ncbi:hypothetical protein MCEMSEM23_00503 [Rhabdaerophilaceae bacterium]
MLTQFLTARPPAGAGFANDNCAPGCSATPAGTAGLALCCETNSNGLALASIRPVFLDGALGDALIATRDSSDIIALWRRLGENLRLPLFVQSTNGELGSFGSGLARTSCPRRGGSALTGRRPRFARKRAVPLQPYQPARKANPHGRVS